MADAVDLLHTTLNTRGAIAAQTALPQQKASLASRRNAKKAMPVLWTSTSAHSTPVRHSRSQFGSGWWALSKRHRTLHGLAGPLGRPLVHRHNDCTAKAEVV